jgi:hypothetical protein
LRWGSNKVGYFKGTNYGETNIPKSTTNFVHSTGRFKITIIASFNNGSDSVNYDSLLSTGLLTPTSYGFNILYGNSVAGIEGILRVYYAIGGITTFSTIDISSDVEDGGLHTLVFESDGVNVTIDVDGVNKYTSAVVLTGVATDSDHILEVGKDNSGGINHHKGNVLLVKMEDGPGNEVVLFDFNNGQNNKVINSGADASQGEEMNWITEEIYSFVPGDPNDDGFDVSGNPIVNLDQVRKYRRVNAYLKK